CNTINRLIETGIVDAEIIAANTDASHLLQVRATKKVLLGRYVTRGLGAGARPNIGEEAARESDQQLKDALEKPDILIITAGLGGGTGTGSAPYIARMAKDPGALVVGIVTISFSAEGSMRMENAKQGLDKFKRACDTTIVIPNDKLLELVPKLPINEAFMVADEILMHTIRGITDTLTKPALVNLDFNDLRTVMKDGGMALVGIGESDTPDQRAEEAVEEALSSPLIDNMDFRTARGALIRVVGGQNMTIKEAQSVAELVQQNTGPQTRIIWGCEVDPTMQNELRVMIILTGIGVGEGMERKERTASPAKRKKVPKRKVVRPTTPPKPVPEEQDLGMDVVQ
ncbi:MAG: cell division protein FtsZ, partial [Thermoplasmata archaeon]|nr:cell division protein FtsZ [Thermoplasmata archaeon]